MSPVHAGVPRPCPAVAGNRTITDALSANGHAGPTGLTTPFLQSLTYLNRTSTLGRGPRTLGASTNYKHPQDGICLPK